MSKLPSFIKIAFVLKTLIFSNLGFAQKMTLDSNFLNSIVGWDHKIIDAHASSFISPADLYDDLSLSHNVILGEWHYNTGIQAEQANTIIGTISAAKIVGTFTVGWEFLNVSEQAYVDNMFKYFKNDRITAEQLSLYIQNGNPDAKSYAPILQAVKDYSGQLLATNLTRTEKAPVTAGGISKVDPNLLPPDYETGSAEYLERFIAEMGGHASPAIANYFDAQCLTDDVIAFSLLGKANYDHKFLVVGSFHADYFDGVYARIKKRAPSEITKSVRFIDASMVNRSQLINLISHPKYGAIADYIIVINEPKN